MFSGYELYEHIADGGMSQVFRGRRADGRFERDVAVKVSAGSIFDNASRERLFQEQQILAALNHPSIAQLYDAGISDEGWPYIVMELVDGVPIDVYCAGVGLDEKLELLARICSALTFAHSHLVVHRDIKPSNVLVTPEGLPKLLDFGIAKLLSVNDKATRTLALTPHYASPEQLLGQPPSVASDVYQVGLLLARLLDPDLVHREPDLEQAIRRASSGTDLELNREVRRALPRELVNIVEQCVRTKPAERYGEVSDVREELENYLTGYPIRASGNSRRYRARKFVRRNAVPLAATAMAAIAFLVSGTWYLMAVNEARHRAELEARAAQRVTDFLVEIFNAPDPQIALGNEVTARDLLDQGLARLAEDRSLAPRVEARLYGAIGRARAQLGLNDEAEPVLRRAIALHEQVSPTARETLSDQNNLAMTLRNLGRFEEAVAVAGEALAKHEQHHPPDDRLRISLINNLAASHQQWGNLAAAEDYYRRGNRLIEQHGIPSEVDRAWFHLSYGHLLNLQGKGEEAEAWMRPVYERARNELGPHHPATLSAATNLGHSLHIQERFREAFPLFEAIHAGRVRTLGADHAETLAALANVGSLHIALEQFDEAEAALSEAVARLAEVHGAEHPITLHVTSNHGQALLGLGRYQEAVSVLSENLAVERRVLGEDHPYTLDCQRFLVEALLEAGRTEGAAALAERTLPILQARFGETHSYTAEMEDFLSRAVEAR